MKRLDAAPREHAEALLVAYDLLQEMHDQGILDTLHGMVHAKNQIAGHVAEGLRMQESIDALRNLVSATKLLGAIDPEAMSRMTRAMGESLNPPEKPLGLFGLMGKALSVEGRRGLTVMVELLVALGSKRR